MQPVFTAELMRDCDRRAIEEAHVPGIVLMENASRGAVDAIENKYGTLDGKNLVIVCGKGNNGGDGYGVARHALNRGARVTCAQLCPEQERRGDARVNLEILMVEKEVNSDVAFHDVRSSKDLVDLLALESPDLIVDAVLGTGFTGQVDEFLSSAFTTMNEYGCPIVALDIPSGIHANTGTVGGNAIIADLTPTMGGLKQGLLFGDGFEHAGEIVVVDIGMPPSVTMGSPCDTWLVDEEDVWPLLMPHRFDVHKYQNGSIFLIAGSPGLTGAATLASEAALRAGGGMVWLGVPASLNPILEEKLTEVMTVPLAENADHMVSMAAWDTIASFLRRADAAVVGPGMGRNEETGELIRRVIREAAIPLVVDADALFALIGHTDILKAAPAARILTPHLGEFARLIGKSSRDLPADRVAMTVDFASAHNVTLVLKGAPTITADSDGAAYINSSGNPGMATAGSGDVLSGIIAAFLTREIPVTDAVSGAVYIHGAAGDIAAARIGENGMISGDLLDALPQALKAIENVWKPAE